MIFRNSGSLFRNMSPIQEQNSKWPEATHFLELTDSTVCAGILLTRPLTAHNYQAVYQYMVVYVRRVI